MRYVILLALILLAVLFYRWRKDRTARHRFIGNTSGLAEGELKASPKDGRRPPAPTPPRRQAEATVRCTECGLVIPASEAVRLNGHPFCSTRHAQDWQARHSR